eukprot:jgi/Ulvmu1/10751/UM068_0041.1
MLVRNLQKALPWVGKAREGWQTAAVSTSIAVLKPERPEPVPISKLYDNFLDGTSSTYLEDLERRYQSDPNSVDKSWASFFSMADRGIQPDQISEAFHAFAYKGESAFASPLSAAAVSNQTIQESMRLLLLIRAFQVSGHFAAQLDPLNIWDRPNPVVLNPETYGFSESDMDREFYVGSWNMTGFLHDKRPVRTLRDTLNQLQTAYCGKIGFEYMHMPNREKCNWLRERIELPTPYSFSPERKRLMLDRLAWSDMFETFLANKYAAAKRFGLEGAESLVPGMKALIDSAADDGVRGVIIGMPHRGRLNILGNVVRKPLRQIFTEFAGKAPKKGEDQYLGSGDVKYHLGTSFDRPTSSGKRVHISLLANPSHLEAVNTIVLGKARARQYYEGDPDGRATMPVLLHGDGAFSGQGIVFETLDMSQLPEYKVGGCVHLVVNNQVAFTTDPRDSRSSPYCTDIAKAIDAPIFHVNGDDVEAVVRVFELAAEWRQTWGSDVIVDLVCYRKHGHNEIDEPMFTQPLMYREIKKHPNAHMQYVDKLLSEGAVTEDEVREVHNRVQTILQEEFDAAKDYRPAEDEWLSNVWEGFKSPAQLSRIRNTGVPFQMLTDVGQAITKIPDGFDAHRQIKKVYAARADMVSGMESLVDWAMAEALAFGTLIAEGNHVRMSGQDVERGTFSHRHAVITDQSSGAKYCPLDSMSLGQAPGMFKVCNSSLSEFGVLGYELGYSMENPNSLVLWEAQFGDFANGAQIIFDQFLSSGEAKWLRQAGLTVLLPHGYDGQGPEHSSARIERFLQMSDENPYVVPPMNERDWFTGGHLGSQIQSTNWQIVNCTTPVNYFHVLRRQIHRSFRKPLVIFTPKSLLRHPKAKSMLLEFDDKADDPNIVGVRFKRLIMDSSETDRSPAPPPRPDVRRIVFCSGKVYYELEAARVNAGMQDQIAIVRVEQLAPFPFDLVMRELKRYPNAEVAWSQEEPMNMGPYWHCQMRIETCLRELGRGTNGRILYAGRPPSAATATGFGDVHAQEMKTLLDNAMDLDFREYM